MTTDVLYVGTVQSGRSHLALDQVIRAHGTRGIYVLLATTAPVLPARAPELAVDPQDVQEAMAVMLAAHPTIRQAAVDGFAQMADDDGTSVRGHSVANAASAATNHNGGTGSDLPVCSRWVAPPSGLELPSPPCRRVRLGSPQSASKRERGGRQQPSCRSVRVTRGWSVANFVTTRRLLSRGPPLPP